MLFEPLLDKLGGSLGITFLFVDVVDICYAEAGIISLRPFKITQVNNF
jgi:hypothetical protein